MFAICFAANDLVSSVEAVESRVKRREKRLEEEGDEVEDVIVDQIEDIVTRSRRGFVVLLYFMTSHFPRPVEKKS